MYLPKDHPDREERIILATKITSQYETSTESIACIPLSMRYPKDLQWWPIEILRALGDVADEMPGIENCNKVYDLLVEGKMKRKKDSSNTLPAKIQLSDISYVQEQRYNEGKQKMVDTTGDDDGMFTSDTLFEAVKELTCAEPDSTKLTTDDDEVVDSPYDTDDADDAIKPGKTSRATATLDTTVATINQQDDDSDALPANILPTDSQEDKYRKWNLWINHYWQVQDCRDLIPNNMLERYNKIPNRNRELKRYGTNRNGEVLELLYELAKITRMQRKDDAWKIIKGHCADRPMRKDGHKALSISDVKFALDYFRDLLQDERESSAAADGVDSAAASNHTEYQGQEEIEEEASLAGDENQET
ncbi:uncharacterized protein J4E88_009904 [Alternaria novae-zelandiae]|uniref:uncharacterized protein n=1 Tax=Alternaria novae-zelandiae TaxID=430562 RepID=UPI0020C3A124|nr:uncharacterized protein J4E88_009904 [Alternaria novae-zelandiae]KAI4669622.1 hypothetical protein J4E88_009904 [Alternaria novae-zelandiae]